MNYLLRALHITALITCPPMIAAAQTESVRQPLPGQRESPRQLERNPEFKDPQFELGSNIAVYQMMWRERDAGEVIRDVATAASVMLGETELRGLDATLRKALYGEEPGSWARVDAAPQLLVKYDAEFDEFRLINEEIDIQRESAGGLNEEEAQKRAEETLKELIERKVIDGRLYRDAALQLGYRRTGTGTLEGTPDRGQILEYRFTFRPRLGGIQLANAGVRIGIMISGEISSIRVGGVSPIGEWKGDQLVPTREGTHRKIETTPNRLMGRFYRLVSPNADPAIAWGRVMYAMPDGARVSVVPPRLIISFADRHKTDDGTYAVSRRRILGFSLVDAEAEPIDFSAPGKITVDETTRDPTP